MDRISVNTDRLRSGERIMKDCARIFADVIADLQDAAADMPECCVEAGFLRKLESWQRKTAAVKKDADSVAKGLNRSVTLFEDCEAEIQSGIAGITESHGAGGTEIQGINWNKWPASWLDAALDYFNIDEYSRDYEDPGAERERARDEQMREEISEVFDDPTLNKAAWEAADSEGKERILSEIIRRINAIQGSHAKDEVRFFYEEPDSNGVVTAGSFNDRTGKVSMNTYYMENEAYEDVMSTVVHEMRHAYQDAVRKNPGDYEVSEATAKSWDENFENYISYDESQDNYQAYRDQPIERDAREQQNAVDYN